MQERTYLFLGSLHSLFFDFKSPLNYLANTSISLIVESTSNINFPSSKNNASPGFVFWEGA